MKRAAIPGFARRWRSSAARGVEQDLAVIRNPDQGIRDPDSILDFSCLEDLFNYRAFNVLFDPGRALEELLGLAQRRVCEIARNTYRGYVGRTLDASVYTSRVPRLPGLHRLPGLDTDARNGNVLQDSGVNAERFRGIVRRWAMSTPVRCRTAFHAAGLAAALTAWLAVPPAHAHSPCDPTDNDRAEASRVLAGLTREIDVMEATIVEALRLQTGQLSGYAAQSAKAVTGALDAQTKLQAQIAREVEETRAMRAAGRRTAAAPRSPAWPGLPRHGKRRKAPMCVRQERRRDVSRATAPPCPMQAPPPATRPASRA